MRQRFLGREQLKSLLLVAAFAVSFSIGSTYHPVVSQAGDIPLSDSAVVSSTFPDSNAIQIASGGRVTIFLDSSDINSLRMVDSLKGGQFTLIVRDFRSGEGKTAYSRVLKRYKISRDGKNEPRLLAVVHNGTKARAVTAADKSSILKALEPSLVWKDKTFKKAIMLKSFTDYKPYPGSVDKLAEEASSGDPPDSVIFAFIEYPYFEGVDESRDLAKLLNEAVRKMLVQGDDPIHKFGEYFVTPPSDGMDDSRMLSQYFVGSVSVANFEPNIISLSGHINAYLGGAHQTGGFSGRNINLLTRKDIGIKELFTENSDSSLMKYGAELLKADSDNEYEFFIPDNFSIVMDGIYLFYQLYDFGGFGFGPGSIMMSDRVLRKYYNPLGLLGYRTGALPPECN